ncbi:Nephrocystin-1 [Boothiomyces sp. JEL0866]|nr:Nephrocystin-1 [Boothiomyces sp. JEL0866]
MAQVVAKYDYNAVTAQEINITAGNVYSLVDKDNDDWWLVEDHEGNQGYVPASYVETTNEQTSVDHVHFQNQEQTEKPKVNMEEVKLTKSKEKIVEQVRRLQNASKENLLDTNPAAENEQLSLSKEIMVEQVKKMQNSSKENLLYDAIQVDDRPSSSLEKNVKIESSKNVYQEITDAKQDSSESEEESEESEESEEESEESEEESEESEQEEQDSDVSDESAITNQVQSVIQNLRKRKSQVNKVHRGIKLAEPEKIEGFESVPFGFKSSILAQNYYKGAGQAISYLTPQLNSCGLAFKDLHLGKKNAVRKRSVKCNITFYVKESRFVPPPQPLPVIGRHVRMALFDKTNIVSNIHSVPASLAPEHENHWRFTPKCFARTFDSDLKLCILFELCLIVKKSTEDDQEGLAEISCGWCVLPLFTSDGKIVEPKTYELPIYTGSPFDKEIVVASSPAKEASFLGNLFSGSRTPTLVIKVAKLDKKSLNYLNDLPDVLIGGTNSLQILAIYRQVLANTLLGKTAQPLGSKYEPVLSIVPRLLEEVDLLNHFITLWRKRYSALPSGEKKSFHKLKKQFTASILTVWPLFYIDMPRYIPGNVENMVARNEIWIKLQEQGIMVFLTKPGNTFRPFATEELEYSFYKGSKLTTVE